MKKSKLEKDKANPYSKYWRNKCESAFMLQFRGLPCEICGTTEGTAGHHVLYKGRFGKLRYEKKNIVVLCNNHHMWDSKVAAHSKTYTAQKRWIEWFEATKPDQALWVAEQEAVYSKLDSKIDYKELYERIISEQTIRS